MTLHFTKMNGAGNDFILVDNRALSLDLTREQIALLCDRHRGIGADGLLAAEPAEAGADFKFRYYNADGGEAEMCGNGARCFARFARRLTGRGGEHIRFETIAGTLSAECLGALVRVTLSDPFGLELNAPVSLDGFAPAIHLLNTGVPHAVAMVDSLDTLDVVKSGAAIRYHKYFHPEGTNANFVEILAPGHLAIRTYERGVEGETLACGTGMAAGALVHHLLTGAPSPVMIEVRSGETLEIGFVAGPNQSFSQVTLTGPADFVFEGEIEIA